MDKVKKYIDFFYLGLSTFYPNILFGDKAGRSYARTDKWHGWTRREFEDYLFSVTETYDIDSAAKKILKWRDSVNKGAVDSTMPPQDILEKANDTHETVKKETGIKQAEAKKNSQLLAERAKEQKTKQPKSPEETPKTPPTEAPKAPETPEAFQEGDIGIQLEPMQQSAVLSPQTYLTVAATHSLIKDNPQVATPLLLMSAGITPEMFQKTANEGSFSSSQQEKTEVFVDTMRRIQKSSPVIRDLMLRRSPQIRTFRIFSNIGALQEAGLSQGEIIRLTSANINIEGNLQPTFSAPQALLKKWTGNIGGQIFGGIFRRGSERTLTRAGIKLFGKAGGRAVQMATGKAILSKVSMIFGPEAWIATEIVTRAASFLKKHWKKVVAVLAGVALMPFIGLLGAAAAGAGIWVGLNTVLGGSAGFTSATASLGALPGFILSSLLLPSIAGPLLFALIGIPLIVAFILFVINSGAFIVPPKLETLGAIQSPYIGVEKEASPEGPFDNGDLPLKIEYTVTIRAKKGALTNISFENTCRVTKDGPSPVCDVPVPNESPESISPTKPFVFAYTKDFGVGFEDSFITDIFQVTADAPEQKGALAATSAVIKIGDPPEECPAVWPIDSGYITQGAFTPSGFSHSSMEAIDIGANLRPVFAGHSGTVITAQRSSCIGNYIDIISTCEGREYISRYAHLEGVSVKLGQEVTMSQTIGLSGNTGSCTTGPHLHYRFKYTSGSNPSFPNNPPFMMRPYIPTNVPRGCTNSGSCGVSI